MTMTQCLSSRDPTEKFSIFHSYISMSSSEDAGVGHGGDFHWVPCIALALWPDVECLCDVCERSHEGQHLPPPSISNTRYEPVFPSAPAVRQGHLGWYPSPLPTAEVPHRWRVWLGYPSDTDCFSGFQSFGAISPELPCGVWSIRAFLPFSDLLGFWFVFFFWSSSSRSTLGSWSWVYSYPRCAPWM